MNRPWAIARPLAGVSLVLLAFVGACTHRSDRGAALPATVETAPTGELTGEQQQQAEALAWFATGVSAEMRRGLDTALDYYQRAFEADPGNVKLGIGVAQSLLARKQYSEAREILERASAANPKSAEPFFWLGVTAKAEEQLPAAVTALQRAVKIDPTSINAIHLLNEIYLLQTNTTDVVKLLDHAYRQKSDDAAYWLRIGDLYAMSAKQNPALTNQLDLTRVARAQEKAQAFESDDADVNERLAALHEGKGNNVKAAEIYTKLVGERPDDLRLRRKLADLYLSANEKEKAIGQLQELIKREPLRFEIYNVLGALYEDLDQNEQALRNYQQSLIINPNQNQVYLPVVMLQMALKQLDDARLTLEQWRDKFPTDFRIPYVRGMMLADEKKYAEAVAAYMDAENLAAEAPQEVKFSAQFYFSYGAACERTGDLEKAAKLFQKAIELDPADHMAHNYLGYMWADKGIHLEEAYKLIKVAIEREPDNGAYLDSLGWVLYRLGRADEALPHLKRAAELEKDDPTLFDHLAEVMEKLGRRNEAIAYLQQAVKAAPENKELAEKLQKLSGK